MTPKQGMGNKIPPINFRNLGKALTFADRSGVSTVLITGKGEPTLFPEHISDYLRELQLFNFPFIELQSNMLLAFEQDYKMRFWYEKGLTTVCISVVHYDDEMNSKIYTPGKTYPSLSKTIDLLHDIGFSVRLSCVGVKGYIDDVKSLKAFMRFAKENDVEQVSYCPMTNSSNTQNKAVSEWVNKNLATDYRFIVEYVKETGTHLLNLSHGAVVYDLKGQNLCLKNCLTRDPEEETVRQLIFFPEGRLSYDWEYEGARIL
jgi:molybdenum cofactor biosynthesis enzyme MoaA